MQLITLEQVISIDLMTISKLDSLNSMVHLNDKKKLFC